MIAVQPTPQPLPKGFQAPSTTQSMLKMLAKYTKYQVTADSQVMVVSTNTPAVADQNRAWLRIDAYGRPSGFFLWYKTAWRRVPIPRNNEVRMFNGIPATYFDSTGLGLAGGGWDGWALCNGNNATPDLRDRFIVVAPVAAQQQARGGSATLTISLTNLPRITGAIGELYDFKTGGGMVGWSGLHFQGGARQSATVVALNTGLSTPISILPPYVAVGFAMWIGYA